MIWAAIIAFFVGLPLMFLILAVEEGRIRENLGKKNLRREVAERAFSINAPVRWTPAGEFEVYNREEGRWQKL